MTFIWQHYKTENRTYLRKRSYSNLEYFTYLGPGSAPRAPRSFIKCKILANQKGNNQIRFVNTTKYRRPRIFDVTPKRSLVQGRKYFTWKVTQNVGFKGLKVFQMYISLVIYKMSQNKLNAIKNIKFDLNLKNWFYGLRNHP